MTSPLLTSNWPQTDLIWPPDCRMFLVASSPTAHRKLSKSPITCQKVSVACHSSGEGEIAQRNAVKLTVRWLNVHAAATQTRRVQRPHSSFKASQVIDDITCKRFFCVWWTCASFCASILSTLNLLTLTAQPNATRYGHVWVSLMNTSVLSWTPRFTNASFSCQNDAPLLTWWLIDLEHHIVVQGSRQRARWQ